MVAFFNGIQLLSLRVMGECVGYDEACRRPEFIIESRDGFDEAE
jgi:hypothetical protein